MKAVESLWRGARCSRIFNDVPGNIDEELRSHDICPGSDSFKRREMKRFLFPPCLLSVNKLERAPKKTYESLTLFEILNQEIRVTSLLTNIDVLKDHKRHASDGRTDWNRILCGYYGDDLIFDNPFHVSIDSPFDTPIMPARSADLVLEQERCLRKMPRAQRLHYCYGSTIAPISSNMWFDVEHIKNRIKKAFACDDTPKVNTIIEERMCLENAESAPFLHITHGNLALKDWGKEVQKQSVLKSRTVWNIQDHRTTPYMQDPSLQARKLSSSLSRELNISNYPNKWKVFEISLKELLQEAKAVSFESKGYEAPRLSGFQYLETEEFNFVPCVTQHIEAHVLQNCRRKAPSVVITMNDVLSLTDERSEKDILALAQCWRVYDLTSFCTERPLNRFWTNGPRDMMLRCTELPPCSRHPNIPIDMLQFKKLRISIDVEELCSLWKDLSCEPESEYAYMFNECLRIQKSLQKCVASDINAHSKTVFEPEYDPPPRRVIPPQSLNIKARSESFRREQCFPLDQDFFAPQSCTPKSSVEHVHMAAVPTSSGDKNGINETLFDIYLQETQVDLDNGLNEFVDLVCTEKQSKATNAAGSIWGGATDEEIMPKYQRNQYTTDESSLKVPSKMICRPWMLHFARECMRVKHASLYIPPPLSCLPSLCIVAHTLLASIDDDFRVLMFCAGNSSFSTNIKRYVDFLLGDQYSIAVSTQKSSAVVPEDAIHDGRGVENSTTRVLVTDSADELVNSSSFSVVLILLTPADEGVRKNQLCQFSDLISSGTRGLWKKFMTLVAPYGSNLSFSNYHAHLHRLAPLLQIEKAIFCHTLNEEISISLSLSQHENMILVPSRTASNAMNAIDETSKPLIQMGLSSDSRVHRAKFMLKSMTPKEITREILSTSSRDEAKRQALVQLHTMRHARSYALYDGAIAALAYLRKSISELGNDASQTLVKVKRALAKEAEEELASKRRYHPIIIALRKLLEKEERDMKEHRKEISKLWMCQTYSPLVITESDVMFSGILDGLEHAVQFKGTEKGKISVCVLDSLLAEKHEGQSGQHFSQCFSHVILISEDRTGEDALGRIPCFILNVWYATGLRLVRVIVDEHRRLEHRIERSMLWYHDTQKKLIPQIKNVGDNQGFITTASLCPRRPASPRTSAGCDLIDIVEDEATTRPEEEMRDISNSAPVARMRFSESDILGTNSDEEMRQKIVKHPMYVKSANGTKIHIDVVLVGAQSNAALMRIASAIVMDKDLFGTVIVRFTL